MILLGELKNKKELEYLNTGGLIVYHEHLSCAFPDKFSTKEIKEIKSSTSKPVFLSLMPLYHDNDYQKLQELISELQDLDGFFFQDLGIIKIFKELNIEQKAIYYPLTFLNNYLDGSFFEGDKLSHFQISKEITLQEIEEILSKKEAIKYSYSVFGYQNIFYSLRQHFSNYRKHASLEHNLHNNFDLTIKEETRNEFYRALEDDYGFYIFKDKIFNGYQYFNNKENFEYLILNRIFVEDKMYFDTISLFNNEISFAEYNKKYSSLIDEGYLFKPVGLLKADSNE